MTTVPALVDEIPLDQYVSTAGQTDFNFTYMIFATTDIKVYVNGVLKTITTDYTVKTAGGATITSADLPMDGGKVVFITPLALNDAVSLSRDIPISRLTGYSVAGAFRADVVNAEFTKIYAVMQQLERDLFRGITLAPYDTAGDNLVLPAVRANSFLAFDADGNIITAASSVTGALVSEFMETVLDDQSALEARATLGLVIGTNVQAWDAQLDTLAALATANLSALAGLTGAADKVPYFTAAGAMALSDRQTIVAATESVAGIAEIATQAITNTGTNNTDFITPLTLANATSIIKLGTAVSSTNNTSFDFTGIPAGTKRIIISYADISTNGTSRPMVQLGDSGGIETTGYLGSTSGAGAGSQATTFTTGFHLADDTTAASVRNGSLMLSLISAASFRWAAFGISGRSDTSRTDSTGGSKALSAELDRVRITMANGTDQFDGGTINIQYE